MSGVDSITDALFTNRNKLILGIISLVLGIFVLFMTSPFVGYILIIPFIILTICLMVPSDSIKNSKIIGVIFILFSLFVIYSAINVILNPYDVVTSLYVNGIFATTPGPSEISACTTAYIITLIYAIYNLLCSISFFFATSSELD